MGSFRRDKTFTQRVNLTAAFMTAYPRRRHRGADFLRNWKAPVVAVVLWCGSQAALASAWAIIVDYLLIVGI